MAKPAERSLSRDPVSGSVHPSPLDISSSKNQAKKDPKEEAKDRASVKGEADDKLAPQADKADAVTGQPKPSLDVKPGLAQPTRFAEPPARDASKSKERTPGPPAGGKVDTSHAASKIDTGLTDE